MFRKTRTVLVIAALAALATALITVDASARGGFRGGGFHGAGGHGFHGLQGGVAKGGWRGTRRPGGLRSGGLRRVGWHMPAPGWVVA